MVAPCSAGLGLVLVEYEYKYQGRDGAVVSIKPNERYILLSKTNEHWWQVQSHHSSKPFYIPAKYVKELPQDFPSLLDFPDPPSLDPAPLPTTAPAPVPVPVPVLSSLSRGHQPGLAGHQPGSAVKVELCVFPVPLGRSSKVDVLGTVCVILKATVTKLRAHVCFWLNNLVRSSSRHFSQLQPGLEGIQGGFQPSRHVPVTPR